MAALTDEPLRPDEVAVPNQLVMKRPLLPWSWPFDWTAFEAVAMAVPFLLLATWVMNGMDDPWGFLNWWVWVAGPAAALVYWRPHNRWLGYWLGVSLRFIGMMFIARVAWLFTRPVGGEFVGWTLMTPKLARSLERVDAKGWAIYLPSHWAKIMHANIFVREDGLLDVLGIPLPRWRWIRFAVSLLMGKARLRVLLEVTPDGNVDLLPDSERRALLANRHQFWLSVARLRRDLSCYLRVRPFPPDDMARAAGPVAKEAREWCIDSGLVQRRAFITVSGITSSQTLDSAKRIRSLLGASGLEAVQLGQAVIDSILDEVWTKTRRPILEIGTGFCRLGKQRYVSYIVTKLPRRARFGWTSPWTSGVILGDVAIHARSHKPKPARRALALRRKWWSALAEASRSDEYIEAVQDADRLSAEIRRDENALYDMGMYLTVPEDQSEEAEAALDASSAEWRPALVAQDLGRKATLGIGADPLSELGWSDASTLAASDLFSTGGIWVPGCTLVGVNGLSPEPIGWNPFDESNENWSGAVLGMMGSGKTNTMMAISRRMAKPHRDHPLYDDPPQIIVLDQKYELEYLPFIRDLCGGQTDSYFQPRSWADINNVPLDAPAIGFNLTHVGRGEDDVDAIQSRFIRDLAELIWDRLEARAFKRPVILIVDEAWLLAQSSGGGMFLQRYGRQARSAYACVLYGTQFAGDLLDDHASAAAIKNCSMRLVLRQTPMERHVVIETLGIGPVGERLLEKAGTGESRLSKGRGIIYAHNRMAPVQVVQLGDEGRLFGTNPQERIRRDTAQQLQVIVASDKEKEGIRNGHV